MAETPPSALGSSALPAPQNSDTPVSPSVVVKKYANRRLYNTETSSYITLENLAEMIRGGRDFVVYDAKSGEDITRGVLTQIIVEEESKGSAMLPTGFLRQLIGFYGGSLQGVVPRYLEHSMSSFARQQQQVRQMMERTFSPFLPTGMEEMNRQNMALFERAVSLWNPFHRASDEPNSTPNSGSAEPLVTGTLDESHAELERLRHEVESLKQQLASAHAAAVLPELPSGLPETVPGNVPANVLSDPPKAMRKPARNRTSVDG